MSYNDIDKYLRKRVILYNEFEYLEFFVDEISPSRRYIKLTYPRNFDDGLVQTVSQWIEYEFFKSRLREVL